MSDIQGFAASNYTPRSPKNLQVMVVDDVKDNTEVISRLLQIDGFLTITYTDSRRALADLEEGKVKPDILLLDVMMPDLDGYQMTQKLRSNLDLPYFPIVLLTALIDDKSRAEGRAAGADEFLSKPVSLRELSERMKTVIQLKQSLVELRSTTQENRRINSELRQRNAELSRQLQSIMENPAK